MKTNLLLLCFIYVILSLVVVLPATAERSVRRDSGSDVSTTRSALVIGNSKYSSSPLKNPVNDAADIAKALRKSGFDVVLLKNASRKQMKLAIKKFGHKLQKGGVGLFYFAGHGLQVEGHNYLVPIGADLDTESDVEFETIDAGRILGKMEDAGNNVNIVILDACRNNPYARSFRSARKGLAQMDAPTGSIVAYATAPGSVASDGRGRNGVYTKYLLQYLRESGLTLEQVFKRVRESVLRETGKKQTPWESSSLIGDFYFRGSAGGTTSTADREVLFWQSINTSTDPAMFKAYLDQFPNGTFAGLARVKLSKLGQSTDMSTLTVYATPKIAKVRILNIAPAYHPKISLAPGRYHLEASATGYITKSVWIDLPASGSYEYKFELQGKPVSSQGVMTDTVTGMKFVFVKGGCYQMGDTFGEGSSDEKPVHEVCVDDFHMGKYEVTQGQYKAIMGRNPSYFKNGNNHPVEKVSWDDAQTFIKKLNQKTGKTYRLPTEAEWEYAARSGGKKQKYAGGNNVDAVAWYGRNSGDKTHPVGQKQANGLGLYDISGNVWEWCSDWYGSGYYGFSSRSNPQGPISGSYRVLRGGSYINDASYARTASRLSLTPGKRYDNMGFRLVLLPSSQQ